MGTFLDVKIPPTSLARPSMRFEAPTANQPSEPVVTSRYHPSQFPLFHLLRSVVVVVVAAFCIFSLHPSFSKCSQFYSSPEAWQLLPAVAVSYLPRNTSTWKLPSRLPTAGLQSSYHG